MRILRRHLAGEWSAIVHDDCPFCGALHLLPYRSDDLSVLIEPDGDRFVVLVSPDTAEAEPDYEELGGCPSLESAAAFLAARCA